MKVFIDKLFLTNKGGIYIYFEELASFLKKRNIDFSSCNYNKDLSNDSSSESRKKRFFERIRRCFVDSKFDIFHSSYYRLPSDTSIKVVTTVHDFTHQKYYNIFSNYINLWIKLRAIKRSNAIICISENTKEDLLNFYNPRDDQILRVIYNGISSDYKKIDNKDFTYDNYFLFVGHRVKYKNFDFAIELLRKQNEFKLIVVGGDQDKEAFFLNIDKDLRNRIIFKGFVSNNELNKLYNRAFCLFYPSSYEGFGIPVIEAMAAGCPVIANDECLAVREIAQNNALFFSHETKNFNDVFEDLCQANRKEIIINAKNQAKNFNWSKTFNAVLNVYNSLVVNK